MAKQDLNKKWLKQKYLVEGLKSKDIAELAGCNYRTIERRLAKHNITKKDSNSPPKKEESNNGLETVILKQLEGLTSNEIKTVIKNLKTINPQKYNPVNLDYSEKHIKYGYFSDAHMGHKCYRADVFRRMAEFFKREGVEFIVNAGDTIEGMSNRDGHVFELDHIGITAQVKFFAEEFKLLSDWTVYSIEAQDSHGGWSHNKGNQGLNIGEYLSDNAPNYEFIGFDEQDLKLGNGLTIRLRHPGGGTAYALCFDDNTEILTDDGWKLFKDLNHNEKVATLNIKTDTFEWQNPTDYTDEEYNGELLHFNAKNIDLMVTPNHRMLVRRYPNNLMQFRKKKLLFPTKSHKKVKFDWVIKEAKDLVDAKRQEWQMKRNVNNWEGKLIEKVKIPYLVPKTKSMLNRMKHVGTLGIDDVAELIAWYVTEGYIRKTALSIAQYERVNPTNYYEIIDLFKRCNIKCNEEKRKQHLNVYSKELCDWLLSECGHLSRNKYLPKWLKNQPKSVLRIVFDTMIKGDGWINGKGYGYKSISKQLLGDMSEIALKLGYAVTTNKDSISISKKQVLPTINTAPKSIRYGGKIYCVSVPNTIIMVRRNGKAIWSGNSYKMQKYIESIGGGDKPNILHTGHFHKYNKVFYRNIHGIDCGALQNQSPFLKKKGSPSHVGFGMVDAYMDKDGVERLSETWVPFYD